MDFFRITAGRDITARIKYLIAAGIFCAALGLRFLVLPVEAGLAFLTFYPGTAIAALLCGVGPSLFYMILAAVAGAYIFNPPHWAFGQSDIIPTCAFIVSATTILFVVHSYQRVVVRQTQNLTDEIDARQRLASELQNSLNQLRELESEFRQTFEQAAVGIAHLAPDGRWLRVNECLCNIIGYSRDELLSKTLQDIAHPDDVEANFVLLRRILAGDLDLGSFEKQYLRKDGGTVWINLAMSPARTTNGHPSYFIAVLEDITNRKHAEMQLRLAAKVFDRAGEAIIVTEVDGRIITVNEAFTGITGYTVTEAVGKTPSLLKSGLNSPEFYRSLWGQLETEGWWQGEIWNKRKNGEIYPEWLTISSVREADGRLSKYVAMFSDISAMKESQRKLEYIASHDDLTALSNRTVFQNRLRQAIAQARRESHLLAVLFIDLDNFKTINDTLGHDVGDLLLKGVAQRLLTCIRDADTVARLGGDEFAALLCNIDFLEVSAVCQRIVDALSKVFQVMEHDLFITSSIGISLFPNDGNDEGTLLKNADSAMYRAKEQGKNHFQYFAADIRLEIQQRLALETGLRRALQQSLFVLHYQPQVRLADSNLVGAEALIRWTDPELGFISPAEFIPVAEKSGLIGGIGLFVVNRAIEDILAWRSVGLTPPPVALNISPSQLRDDRFAAWLFDRLATAGLPTSSIVIELTEGALMEHGEEGLKMLNDLASRGIKISIDDFGTGYSSLSYLKRMPVAELKIDRSFVDGIANEPDARAIAHAILSLAHTLGLSAVAEGVETEQQLTVLQMLGCDTAQGFFFHRPMDEAHFRLLLQSDASAGVSANGAPT
ncbi:EAL domain-containing protein [Denitratisoma oestradiolicum]|uniref:Protein-glutamate methylesterase n=1 Tax=Denitratisoma oestradiolicum TaxID=311182 RepID=A0A6S6XT26_9PROT